MKKMYSDGEHSQRNMGIDLLRCLSMFLIVCLHVMNRGGAIPAQGTLAGSMFYPLRILASSAVNVYALISGYVLLNGRFRPARVVELWLQVLVLNVSIGIVGSMIQPGAMDTDFWIRYLFPFTQKAFWYFTAYVGVYAFSPVINRGIRALDRRQAVVLIWLMLAVFSLGSYFGYAKQGDPFSINAGYSVLWLLVLYVIGACIRHSGFARGTSTRTLLLFLCGLVVLLTLLWLLFGYDLVPEWAAGLSKQMLSYTSPGITAVGLLLLLLFSRIRMGRTAAKAVSLVSPLTFGVYIIHVHHVIWMKLNRLFEPLLKLPDVLIPFAVLGCALLLFFACLLLDELRALLFRLLRVRKGLDRLEIVLRNKLNRKT